jgi:hypothetical protein
MTIRLDGLRRGVAQPGRAPGSGPGGRRFKSSLPDHLFSARYTHAEALKIPAVGKNATVFTSAVFRRENCRIFQEITACVILKYLKNSKG